MFGLPGRPDHAFSIQMELSLLRLHVYHLKPPLQAANNVLKLGLHAQNSDGWAPQHEQARNSWKISLIPITFQSLHQQQFVTVLKYRQEIRNPQLLSGII
jgi:hypothetical protein